MYEIPQRICLALPDAFINPRTWTVHSDLLRQVLTEDILHNTTGFVEEVARDLHHTLLDQLSDIKRRNEAMLFHNFPTRGIARLGGAVSDIQVRDSVRAFLRSHYSLFLSFSTLSQVPLTWTRYPSLNKLLIIPRSSSRSSIICSLGVLLLLSMVTTGLMQP
jgi:hypothetical protein